MRRIIFIVGFSRSGTKMLNRILETMGITQIISEMHFFEQVYNFTDSTLSLEETLEELIENVRKRDSYDSRDSSKLKYIKKVIQDAISTGEVNTPIDVYKKLLGELNDGIYLVDPTPRNAYFISNIKEILPESKFVYMVRDPRDCLLSQSKKWRKYYYDKKEYTESLRLFTNYHPILMSKFWKNSFKEYEKFSSIEDKAKDIILIRYEDITSQPYNTARKLAHFLNVEISDWKKIDLSYVNSQNTYKWKNEMSRPSQYLVQKQVADKIKELRYEFKEYSFLEKVKAELLGAAYMLKYPFILLLNFNRSKNLWVSFKLRVLGR